MTLHTFAGYATSSLKTVEGSNTKQLVLPDGPTHQFEVADDDGALSGSGSSYATSGDATQSAALYQGDKLVSSGTVYAQRALTFSDEDGTVYEGYQVRIEETGETFYVFKEPAPPGGTALNFVSSARLDDAGASYTDLAGDDIRDSDARTEQKGPEDEEISTGAGNDGLATRGGNDTVYLGDGDDVAYAGTGDDVVHGEAGNDSLFGEAGNDSLFGGDGNDSIEGGDGADLVMGGAGSDTIWGGAGNDTLYGNDGIDYILGDDGDDSIYAGAGDDGATGGAGNDIVYGGLGSDTLYGGAGDDILLGDGERGVGGDDTLIGEAGNDTLYGYDGDDVMTGGAGNDFFIVSTGQDTITDFGAGSTGSLDDGDIYNNDYINLTGYYDSLAELRADHADDGVLNQSNAFDAWGKAVDYADNTQFGASSLTVQGASASDFTADTTGIDCFAAGTRILTPRGPVAVETLRRGDLVVTLDHGLQPCLWIGISRVPRAAMAGNERLRPVLIRQGIFGAERDLMVSRQHGLLTGSDRFARAIHLTRGIPGVRVARGKRAVTYVHILLRRHGIVFAEGLPCESFYPGPNALANLPRGVRRDLFRALPALDTPGALRDRAVVEATYGPTARPFLKRREVAQAVARGAWATSRPAALPGPAALPRARPA